MHALASVYCICQDVINSKLACIKKDLSRTSLQIACTFLTSLGTVYSPQTVATHQLNHRQMSILVFKILFHKQKLVATDLEFNFV